MRSLANVDVTTGLYNAAPTTPSAHEAPIFDWVMMLLNTIFLAGLYLDGWAHNHGKVDNTFFTPWHAFFYAGFALVACLLVGTLFFNRLRGQPWRTAIAPAYRLALLGVLIFAAAGVGDLIWHELFGIEQDFEALLSPTHLALILGLALVVSGPLRAAWHRRASPVTWRALGPALLSLTALLSAFTFIMMYTHPLVFTIAGARHYEYQDEMGQIAGVVSILITASILMGPTLLVMRRWHLPLGSLLLVWGVNLMALTLLNFKNNYTLYQAAAMLLAVVMIDLLRRNLTAVQTNIYGLRVFAFLAPVLYFGAYFFALLLTEGTHWSVHVLSGAVVLAGVVGWLLSYLVAPPPMPTE